MSGDDDEGRLRHSSSHQLCTHEELDTLETNPSGKWEIVDLTEVFSSSYSPSESDYLSDQEDARDWNDAISRQPIKAKRSSTASKEFSEFGKSKESLKSKSVSNKESGLKKKRRTLEEPPEKSKRNVNLFSRGFGASESKRSKEKADYMRKVGGSKSKKLKADFIVNVAKMKLSNKSGKPQPKAMSEPKVLKVERPVKSNDVISKKSKAEKAVKRFYEYTSETPSAGEAHRTLSQAAIKPGKERDIVIAKEELVMATERAMRAMQEVEEADRGVAEAARQLHLVKRGKAVQYEDEEDVAMGDGLDSFEEKVLAMKPSKRKGA